jgi:glycosyltransferase involved in cell wall biosynthesis
LCARYNGAAYLNETLNSICAQKGIDLEIVVSDDQSADRSMEIIVEFQAKHPDLKWIVLRTSARLGMAGNWNACLQTCTQDFVKVMGQDDVLYPGALFAQAALLAEYPNVGLVSVDAIFMAVMEKAFQAPSPSSERYLPRQSSDPRVPYHSRKYNR